MARKFLQSRKERFKTWWAKPPTRLERLGSAVLGFWAFLLLGIMLGFITATNHTLSMVGLAAWAIGSASFGIILGASFPKYMRCVALPFSVIGIGIGIGDS